MNSLVAPGLTLYRESSSLLQYLIGGPKRLCIAGEVLVKVHRNTIGTWERGEYLPQSKALVLELARRLHLEEHERRQLKDEQAEAFCYEVMRV